MEPRPPKLIVFAGLPGTGKSTISKQVARAFEGAWLSVDTLEASMLKAGLSQTFETGLAAYIGVCDLAAVHLSLGRTVVIDAVNGVGPARLMWRQLSRDQDVTRYIIEITCSDPVEHRRRVEQRPPPSPPLPKPTWSEVCERLYEPWDEPVMSIDSVNSTPDQLSRILRYVGA